MRTFARITAIALAAATLLARPAPGQVNREMIQKVAAGELREAEASWWGFDPDDATECLQSAISSGVPKLIVADVGSPWIVSPIKLASNQEIVFEKGVEILAKRGAFKARNDSLFSAANVENVSLRGYGATFRMWKEDYDNPELYQKAEWRHCLSIKSSSNVNVYGLTLRESGGDGIYLGTATAGVTNLNVHIKDVTCDENYRQGISVITAENLLIEDTVMRNTSGTPPQAGIDFEPNRPSERLVNVVMRNCLTENNRSSGYTMYLRPLDATSEPVSVRIENCRSIGDGGSGARVVTDATLAGSVKGTIEFVGCTFQGSKRPGISVSKPARRGLVRFEDCRVIDCGGDAPTVSPIVFASRAGADTPVGGVQFDGVVLRDPVDRPPMSYHDQGGGIPLADITGNLVLSDAKGRRTEVSLTDERLAEWMPVIALKNFPRVDLDELTLRPLEADSPAAANDVRWPILRKSGEYLLYASQGDEVRFTVNHIQVGRYGGRDMPVIVTAPSGKQVCRTPAPFQQETTVRFAAPETGVYTIWLDAGQNRFQLKDPSHPLNISGDDGPISFIGMQKELTFYVPKGTTEFGVRVFGQGPGEAIRAALVNPAGEIVGEVDNQFETHQFEIELAEPSQGQIWTLHLRKPTATTWEDHFVDLRGVPPVMAPAGAALLVPAE